MGLQAIAAASLVLSTAAPLVQGWSKVEILERDSVDKSRAFDGDPREVPLRIYLPEGQGPFPVIVFSHGLGGSNATYSRLAQCWATHGYAVVLPSHAGSDTKIFRRLRSPTKVMKEAIDDTRNWEDRPRDMSFTIDTLANLNASDARLKGKLDLTHLGMGGHSFGGWTAAAVAGATITFPGETAPRKLDDARPRAFLILSPTDNAERGLHEGAWAAIKRPLLAMTGTEDRTFTNLPYEMRTRPFHDLPPGDKWLVVIEGAEHMTFAGGRPFHRVPDSMERAIEEATLAFWDVELKGDARAKATLQPSSLESDGLKVHVEAR